MTILLATSLESADARESKAATTGRGSGSVKASESIRKPAKGNGDRKTAALKTVDVYHKVRKGDSLWKIAARYKVTVKELQRLNPGVGKRLRPGQAVLVRVRSLETAMKWRPYLADWGQMEAGDGYLLKRENRSFGRTWAIDLLRQSIDAFRGSDPEAPPVIVGDISGRVGGYLPRHLSHKTGRDVDIGYYSKVRDLTDFALVNRKTVDVERTWLLIQKMLATGRIEYIFMDHRLQKVFYEHAQDRGMGDEELDRLFQYPYGRWVRKGIIRHSRGHADHLHIRFTCPEGDLLCR
jgi:LysM repeat protein